MTKLGSVGVRKRTKENYSKNSGYFKYNASSAAPKPAKTSPVQNDNDSGLPKPNAKKPTLYQQCGEDDEWNETRNGSMRRERRTRLD